MRIVLSETLLHTLSAVVLRVPRVARGRLLFHIALSVAFKSALLATFSVSLGAESRTDLVQTTLPQ